LALAASVLISGVGLTLFLQNRTNDEMVIRAANEGPVRVTVSDPAAAQKQLLDAIRTAGIEARGYTLLGRYGVDAELPSGVPPAVVQLLQSWRVPLTRDGLVQVEFEPARQP
jgi:hypothetical protein